jgi:hypothetical protein
MTQLIPDGFLSIRQSADNLATAMYAGEPDRPTVAYLKSRALDVADGAAIDDAVSELWKAYDDGKVEAFLIGAAQKMPLKLPNDMSKGIPGLRSPRGRDFTLLRHRNRHHHQLVEWFGRDLSTVAVVFRETEVRRLCRALLQRRRRRVRPTGKIRGRPPRRLEVEPVICNLIDLKKWDPTKSVKTLTRLVNRQGKWIKPVSEDTVERVLQNLHRRTRDRRYERVEKKRRLISPAQ